MSNAVYSVPRRGDEWPTGGEVNLLNATKSCLGNISIHIDMTIRPSPHIVIDENLAGGVAPRSAGFTADRPGRVDSMPFASRCDASFTTAHKVNHSRVAQPSPPSDASLSTLERQPGIYADIQNYAV